jgi:hypothetical protein
VAGRKLSGINSRLPIYKSGLLLLKPCRAWNPGRAATKGEGAVIRRLLRGRVKSDYQVSYYKGASVRRVERGRKTDWYINGVPVPEQQAVEYMCSRDPQ